MGEFAEDVVLLDVCPFSLGIAVVNDENINSQDMIMSKIIKKVNGSEMCLNDLFEAVPLLQKEQDNNIEMFNNVENELYELQSKIFNLYEENDEIESDELNRIAKIVLERIEHKLSGTDFSPEIIFDVKKQVERLINEAVSYENLAQSYLGWCPFW